MKTFTAGDGGRGGVGRRPVLRGDARCPHMGGDLGRGRLESGALVCPVHASRFDMCTGEVLHWAPNLGSVRPPGPVGGLLATI
jgi:Rieske Fe-S protein